MSRQTLCPLRCLLHLISKVPPFLSSPSPPSYHVISFFWISFIHFSRSSLHFLLCCLPGETHMNLWVLVGFSLWGVLAGQREREMKANPGNGLFCLLPCEGSVGWLHPSSKITGLCAGQLCTILLFMPVVNSSNFIAIGHLTISQGSTKLTHLWIILSWKKKKTRK